MTMIPARKDPGGEPLQVIFYWVAIRLPEVLTIQETGRLAKLGFATAGGIAAFSAMGGEDLEVAIDALSDIGLGTAERYIGLFDGLVFEVPGIELPRQLTPWLEAQLDGGRLYVRSTSSR